jgi:copper chaperone CopZ
MSKEASATPGPTVLAVAGMTCSTCVRIVTNALSRVPGAEGVEVDLDAGRAVVAGTARPEALVAAVEKAGYDARLA